MLPDTAVSSCLQLNLGDNDSEEDTPRKKNKKEKIRSNIKASNKLFMGRLKESSGEAKHALSSEMEGRGGALVHY